MGYRRDSETQRAWHKWVDQHRDDFVRCCLPEFVYSDKLTWFRFLEHGGTHPQPYWSVGMLSTQRAAALHDFIQNLYGPDEYLYLLQNLKEVLRNPPSS